jgi:hypothetical protein
MLLGLKRRRLASDDRSVVEVDVVVTVQFILGRCSFTVVAVHAIRMGRRSPSLLIDFREVVRVRVGTTVLAPRVCHAVLAVCGVADSGALVDDGELVESFISVVRREGGRGFGSRCRGGGDCNCRSGGGGNH